MIPAFLHLATAAESRAKGLQTGLSVAMVIGVTAAHCAPGRIRVDRIQECGARALIYGCFRTCRPVLSYAMDRQRVCLWLSRADWRVFMLHIAGYIKELSRTLGVRVAAWGPTAETVCSATSRQRGSAVQGDCRRPVLLAIVCAIPNSAVYVSKQQCHELCWKTWGCSTCRAAQRNTLKRDRMNLMCHFTYS